MPPVETLGAFFVASVVMGLAPGPDILFVLTQSALYGARAGFATTCGLITGLFVHITAVSLGVAALFQSSETAFNVLKFAGAACCIWRGSLSAAEPQRLRSRRRNSPDTARCTGEG